MFDTFVAVPLHCQQLIKLQPENIVLDLLVIAHFVGRSAVLRDVITEFVNQVKTKLISKFQAIYKNYLRFYNDTIILAFIKLMEPILHVNCCLNLNE